MILFPNCKINLGLRVIRKREDGYHDLETIFVPIYGLHDELKVNKTEPSSSLLSPAEGEPLYSDKTVRGACQPHPQ